MSKVNFHLRNITDGLQATDVHWIYRNGSIVPVKGLSMDTLAFGEDFVTLNKKLIITETSDSTGPNTGALQVAGGAWIGGDSWFSSDVVTEGSRFTPYIAGDAIGGQRVVVTDAVGKVVHADHTDTDHFGLVTGITSTSAILDEEVLIVSYGRMTDPVFSFTAEEKVYVSTNGLLTQTAPTTGFLQCIGHAVSTDTLFINPQIPTRLA